MKRIILSGVISALTFTPFTSSFAADGGAIYSSTYLKDSPREYTVEFVLDIPKGDQNNHSNKQDVYGDVEINSVNGSPQNDVIFSETRGDNKELTSIRWEKSYWSKTANPPRFEMYVHLTDKDGSSKGDDPLCHWETFTVEGPKKNEMIKSNPNCKLKIVSFE